MLQTLTALAPIRRADFDMHNCRTHDRQRRNGIDEVAPTSSLLPCQCTFGSVARRATMVARTALTSVSSQSAAPIKYAPPSRSGRDPLSSPTPST